MKRVAVGMVVALSTLLLALTVADWIWSIFYSETLVLVRGSHVYAIDNFNGELAFWRGAFKPGRSFGDGLFLEHWTRSNARQTIEMTIVDPMGSEFAMAGFVITTQRNFPTTVSQTFPPDWVTRQAAFAVPSWFLVLLFGALPAVAAYRLFRGFRRHGEGLCKVCGYDLRASSDRCPECGTPITEALPQIAS